MSSLHRWYDERIFQKEAKSLARAGYDVSYIVQHDKIEVIDGIRIVPLPKPAGRLRRLRTDYQLLKLALKENASVYHFHDPELIPVGALLKLLGKKVVYDVHEDYQQTLCSKHWVKPWLRKPFSAVWWQIESVCSRLFFDAILTRDVKLREKFPAHKTEVVNNSPPLSFLDVSATHERGNKFKVVFIGLINKARGIMELVEALDHVRNDCIELHVIGLLDDEQLEQLFEAHPRIVYHGRIPWKNLREIIEGADLGLLLLHPTPAHLGLTGEGNTKLFEFMAVGLPVLISDFPILKEFVCSIGAGYPVDPTDPTKIAQALDYLYEHPQECRTMGDNGRKAVRERYNWEHEEKKLLAVYERIAPNGRQRVPKAAALQ